MGCGLRVGEVDQRVTDPGNHLPLRRAQGVRPDLGDHRTRDPHHDREHGGGHDVDRLRDGGLLSGHGALLGVGVPGGPADLFLAPSGAFGPRSGGAGGRGFRVGRPGGIARSAAERSEARLTRAVVPGFIDRSTDRPQRCASPRGRGRHGPKARTAPGREERARWFEPTGAARRRVAVSAPTWARFARPVVALHPIVAVRVPWDDRSDPQWEGSPAQTSPVRQPHFVTFAAFPLVKAVYLLKS
ncbi:MAG: hypothetical protein WKF73_07055 [Nocardioidaceae bacterium]